MRRPLEEPAMLWEPAALAELEQVIEKAEVFLRKRWLRRHVSRTADVVIPSTIRILREARKTRAEILRKSEQSVT